jgi:hypothetical protein
LEPFVHLKTNLFVYSMIVSDTFQPHHNSQNIDFCKISSFLTILALALF